MVLVVVNGVPHLGAPDAAYGSFYDGPGNTVVTAVALYLVPLAGIAFLWFVVALGTYVSLKSRTTARALVTTVAILFALNGGYLMCCIPLQPHTMLVAAGVTPMIEAVSLLSYRDVNELFATTSNMGRNEEFELFMTCLLGVVGYAGAAAGLTSLALARFDEAADRPRRPLFSPLGPPRWKPKPGGEDAEL